MAGLLVILGLVLTALLSPWIIPYNPVTISNDTLEPPTSKHFFGTDAFGRDIFSRVLAGSALSIYIAIASVGIGIICGIPLGLMSGYFGGKLDEVIMRATDVTLAFPQLLLAIAISTSFGPGLLSSILAVGLTRISGDARLVRGQVLSVKELQFVEAARSLGASDLRILFRHILPNCLAPIIVRATLGMAFAILAAASLSFIGLGAQSPQPEWGLMVTEGRHYIASGQWWMVTFPGLAIMTTIFGFNLLGDGLQDISQPKLRTRLSME